VSLLERARVPRVAAAALVIAVLVSLITATGYAIRDDVNEAVAELPAAARKLRVAAVQSARESPGPMTHVKEAAAELDRAALEAAGKAPAAVAAPPAPAGVEAQFQRFVAQESNNALLVVSQFLVALLLAFFLLAAGDTFRRKVAKLAGASLSRRRVTVEVLNEIDEQIQAYMMTLLVANVLIALATWGALWLLQVPNAGMWAAVTGVLHFIPYAGTAVAASAVGIAAFVDTEQPGCGDGGGVDRSWHRGGDRHGPHHVAAGTRRAHESGRRLHRRAVLPGGCGAAGASCSACRSWRC
jgi:predicted PurR-regulated permease PerM